MPTGHQFFGQDDAHIFSHFNGKDAKNTGKVDFDQQKVLRAAIC